MIECVTMVFVIHLYFLAGRGVAGDKFAWRGSESTFDIEIDGRTYLVANVLPVCVLATQENLQALGIYLGF